MTGFLDPFGGSAVQAAEVSYREIELDADIVLVWPPQSVSDDDYVARTMDVLPSGPGFTITMPDARAVSVGYDFLLTNTGADAFTLLDALGATIVSMASGTSRYVQLTDVSTEGGSWKLIQFGVGTSTADAAALQGLGLLANGPELDVSLQTVVFASNTTLLASQRAQLLVWAGGAGQIGLPTAGSVGEYFFVELRNQGTGSLVVQPQGGEMVDGASNITLQPGDATWLHSGGSADWYTVGLGRNQQFNFTLLTKAVTTGNYTLTPTEAANVVQLYTGVLVGAVTITVPSVVQVYYVSNQTTGAFTLTFQTAGVGATIVVPQGQNAVLFCDGTNIINNSTTVSGITSLQLDPGSAASPSLSYVGDPTTGLYQPSSSTLSVTTAGVERLRVTNTALQLFGGLTVAGAFSITGALGLSNGTAALPALSFTSDPDTGLYRVGADNLGFSAGGTLRFDVSATAVTSTLPVVHPLGAVGAPSITFAGDLDTGVYALAADQFGFATAGVLRLSMNTAAITATLPIAAPLGAVGAPSFTFAGDTNTGVWSPGADTFAVSTAGAERWRVEAAGALSAAGAARTDYAVGTVAFQVEGTAQNTSQLAAFYNAANNLPSQLVLGKSRGGVRLSNTIVADDDQLGQVTFVGSDGAAPQIAALIRAEVDGTPGAGDMPGRLGFFTTPDGSAAAVERMRIMSTGQVYMAPVSIGDVPANTHVYIDRLGDTVPPALTAGTVLTLVGASSAGSPAYLQLISGNAATADIRFGDTDAAFRGAVRYDHATDEMGLAVAGATRLTITAPGSVFMGPPADGNTLNLVQVAGQSSIFAESSLSGGVVRTTLSNTSNTASSDAHHLLNIAGSSGGDPYVWFNINGGASWVVGVDNSDSDSFKISNSSTPGSSDALTITTAEEVILANVTPTTAFSAGYRALPTIGNTATATKDAVGRVYINSGDITINNGVFATGDVFEIYNNSGASITITQGTITTMRLGGTATTGSRTLTQRGMARLFFPTPTTCVVTGSGVT